MNKLPLIQKDLFVEEGQLFFVEEVQLVIILFTGHTKVDIEKSLLLFKS